MPLHNSTCFIKLPPGRGCGRESSMLPLAVDMLFHSLPRTLLPSADGGALPESDHGEHR